ncbi:MAG: GGDEF domain-containing protein [candidate division KSB1 bacterium]|nr:GGDEF domain-containing protein [candidate division KSB1 bacterium]MDZ7294206.1 GGDEF domain-containing protein [candidate division KSB1 bacterium]
MSDTTVHASEQVALLSAKVAELELELAALRAQLHDLQLRHAVTSCLSDDLELLPTLRSFRQAMAAFVPHAEFAVVLPHGDGGLCLPLADESLGNLNVSTLARTVRQLAQAIDAAQVVHLAPNAAEELLPAHPDEQHELLVAPLPEPGSAVQGLLIVARTPVIGFSPHDRELVAAAARELAIVLRKVTVFTRTRELSITDPLTGLYNRRHLEERLRQEVARALRYSHPLTLLLIDIDHFKVYNDVNGHLEGDQALRLVAALLRRHTRQADLVARFGGEEFVVLLPEIDSTGGRAVGEKLRLTVAQNPFPGEKVLPGGKLTISLGIATLPTDAEEPMRLLDLADRGLYLSKQRGRNRLSHFLDEA